MSFWDLTTLAHLLGMALAVGASSVKLALLVRASRAPELWPSFMAIKGTVTRFIVLGLVLLTLSGGLWLYDGYPWSTVLVVKLAIVVLLWVVGPVIDKVAEPRLERLVAAGAGDATPELLQARRAYLLLEIGATGLMYGAFTAGWLL